MAFRRCEIVPVGKKISDVAGESGDGDFFDLSINPLDEQHHVSPMPTSDVVVDMTDKKTFLITPIPETALFQCVIKRKKGLTSATYEFYHESDNLFLLSSKQQGTVCTIAMADNSSLLGSVKHKIVGNTFHIQSESSPDSQTKNEIGFLEFPEGGGFPGFQKVNLLIPYIDQNTPPKQALFSLKNIKSLPKAVLEFTNKLPIVDHKTSQRKLDFKQRAAVPSIKNQQFIFGTESNKPEAIVILQIGKLEENKFTCDFTYPFSPLQAFGVALSIFNM